MGWTPRSGAEWLRCRQWHSHGNRGCVLQGRADHGRSWAIVRWVVTVVHQSSFQRVWTDKNLGIKPAIICFGCIDIRAQLVIFFWWANIFKFLGLIISWWPITSTNGNGTSTQVAVIVSGTCEHAAAYVIRLSYKVSQCLLVRRGGG